MSQNVAEEYHCTNYPEAEELIKHPDVDVIDICLPTYLHEPYVLLAASHGKHILCAKPLVYSATGCPMLTFNR